MAVALIVAAGRGERLGSGRPKALVTLAGRPMLEWSVAALGAARGVERIVVALPPGEARDAPPGTVGVAGGRVRSESVRLALAAAGACEAVIVHDAARPLATAALFERALTELEASGADGVIAAARVSDTIKASAGDGVSVARTLDRTGLWAVQTPQAFRREALEGALEAASPAELAEAGDDAWLIERAGGTVRLLESAEPNLKVTTAGDLRIAELLLSERVAMGRVS